MTTKKRLNKWYLNFCRFFHLHPKFGMPMELFIEPTNICNLKCPLCPTGSGKLKVPQGKMDFNLFVKIADELSPYLYRAQLWGVGEPLLHPRIFDMINYLEKKGVQTQISSNAHFLTQKNINSLIDSKLTHLRISLDGATQATYSQYRKGGTFSQVLDAISKLQMEKKNRNSKRPIVEVQFIVFSHNEHEINEIKKITADLNVKLRLKAAVVGKKEKKMLPNESEISRYKTSEGKVLSKFKQPKTCPFAWNVASINWDGTMVSCCKDPHRNHQMGQLDKYTTVNELWKSKNFTVFRKTFLRDRNNLTRCKKCVLPISK